MENFEFKKFYFNHLFKMNNNIKLSVINRATQKCKQFDRIKNTEKFQFKIS